MLMGPLEGRPRNPAEGRSPWRTPIEPRFRPSPSRESLGAELRGPRARTSLAAAALIGLLLLAVPAAAQYGMWKGRPVAEVTLEGWPEGLDRSVQSNLALSPRKKWLIFDRHVDFYPSLLEDDVQRLRLHLARNGYPDGTIFPRVLPRGESEVRVIFEVEAHEPVRIAAATVRGWPSDAGDPPAAPDAVAVGARLRDAAVESRRTSLQSWLRDRGHARAEVETRLTRQSAHRVDVAWEVRPGARYHFGEIEVTGVESDLQDLARASLGFEVGGLYSRRALRRSEENLRLLGLFRRIDLSTSEADSNTLTIECRLQSRPPRTMRVGAGYWTDVGPGGYAEWWHRNLLRRGRGLQLRVEGTGRLLRARAALQWPALIGPRTLATLAAELRRENEDAYVLREERVGLELLKPLSLTRRLRGGVRVSLLNFDTDEDASRREFGVEDPDGLITRLRLGFDDEASDNPLDPHRGSVTLLELETAPPGLGSVAEYARFTAERSQYFPLGERITGVVRVAGGLAWPLGQSESVLLNERLYAGGSRSVRGYKRRDLGPKDATGDPIGGQSKFETNLELRLPLWRSVFLATFVDTGQVWRDTDAGNLDTLAWASGLGLYLGTPVGVFRVDLGFPLGELEDDQPARVFHISIGQPF